MNAQKNILLVYTDGSGSAAAKFTERFGRGINLEVARNYADALEKMACNSYDFYVFHSGNLGLAKRALDKNGGEKVAVFGCGFSESQKARKCGLKKIYSGLGWQLFPFRRTGLDYLVKEIKKSLEAE